MSVARDESPSFQTQRADINDAQTSPNRGTERRGRRCNNEVLPPSCVGTLEEASCLLLLAAVSMSSPTRDTHQAVWTRTSLQQWIRRTARQKPDEQSQPLNQPQTCLAQRSSDKSSCVPKVEVEGPASDRPCNKESSAHCWANVHHQFLTWIYVETKIRRDKVQGTADLQHD